MQTLQCTESRFVFIFFCPWKRKQIKLRKDIFIGNIGHFLVAQKTHFQQNEKSYRLSNTPLLVLIWYEAIAMKQTNMETQTVTIPFFSGIQFHIWTVCLRKPKELQFQYVAIPFILHWYSLLYLEVCQCGKAWSPPMRHITPTRSSFWPEWSSL